MGRPHLLRLTRQETEIALGENRHVALGAQIGTGSTSTVFRGVLNLNWGIKRPIAVKVFDPVASDERDTVLSTIACAVRDAAALHHPNIAQVLEFGVLDGARPFILEELVTGPSLETFAAGYSAHGLRVPLDLAIFLGVEVAEALSGARAGLGPDGGRVGLLHGDLSARDVLLSAAGEVKVTDFGITAATRAASSVRSISTLARRAATLAPEIVGGADPSPRSDVFSLGVLLWQMLIGPRFPAGLAEAQTLAYVHEGYIHTTVFDPQLPPALKAILRRALEADPEKRYAHAGSIAVELRRLGLAMGVGDGRVFLRYAINRMRAETARTEDDATVAAARDHGPERPLAVLHTASRAPRSSKPRLGD